MQDANRPKRSSGSIPAVLPVEVVDELARMAMLVEALSDLDFEFLKNQCLLTAALERHPELDGPASRSLCGLADHLRLRLRLMAKEIMQFSANYEDVIQSRMVDQAGAVERMVLRNPSAR